MSNFFTEYKNRLAEIRTQYPFLHRFGDAWALALYQQIQEGQINEFVLTTVPIEKTISHINKKFPKLAEVKEGTFGDIYVLFDADSMWEVEDLIKFMDGFGWFPSSLFTSPTNGEKFTEDFLSKIIINLAKDRQGNALIVFEKKFNDQQEIQPFYYHISLDIYHDDIMKVGLIPRSHSKLSTHPQRIYLLNPTNYGNLVSTGLALFDKVKPEIKNKVQALNIYKIDSSKVSNLEVYEDENFLIGDGAVWTQKNIPPNAIKKIGTIDI